MSSMSFSTYTHFQDFRRKRCYFFSIYFFPMAMVVMVEPLHSLFRCYSTFCTFSPLTIIVSVLGIVQDKRFVYILEPPTTFSINPSLLLTVRIVFVRCANNVQLESFVLLSELLLMLFFFVLFFPFFRFDRIAYTTYLMRKIQSQYTTVGNGKKIISLKEEKEQEEEATLANEKTRTKKKLSWFISKWNGTSWE